MISFDEFLKQDDEEKYNNMQYDIFEIQALKNELKNRDIYISKLEVVYSKEIERLNNIPNKIKEYLKQVHIETQNGILSSNNLIWGNIERLCDGKDIIGSDKE